MKKFIIPLLLLSFISVPLHSKVEFFTCAHGGPFCINFTYDKAIYLYELQNVILEGCKMVYDKQGYLPDDFEQTKDLYFKFKIIQKDNSLKCKVANIKSKYVKMYFKKEINYSDFMQSIIIQDCIVLRTYGETMSP